jgi:ADP-ribose pyrophosphatase YjhB (NUDIX family)
MTWKTRKRLRVWALEMSYLPVMLERRLYDTVCHEHLEYYGLRQIEWMMKRAKLRVARVEFNDINGGSFRLLIRHESHTARRPEDEQLLARVRLNEERLGLQTQRPYSQFQTEIETIRHELTDLLKKLKTEGKKVYIYGASTKGNTILQFCGITKDLVGKAADRNPFKWGRRTLGTNISIVSEDDARRDKPDYFLVLPWHFFPEFVAREHAWLQSGGRFIIPLPGVRLVGLDDLFIPREKWAMVTELIPIPTVDLLIMDKDRRILLHKRKNEPAAQQWWFPGGRVHMNEARETAVLRKLMQECGLQAARSRELGTFDIIFETSPRGTARHSITTLYEIEVVRPEDLVLDDQGTEAAWRKCEEWLKEPLLHPFVAQSLIRFG